MNTSRRGTLLPIRVTSAGSVKRRVGVDHLDLPREVRRRLLEYGGWPVRPRRRPDSATCSAKAAMRALSNGRYTIAIMFFDVVSLIEIEQPGNDAGPLAPAVPPGGCCPDSAQRYQVAGSLVPDNVPPAAAPPGLAAGVDSERVAAGAGYGGRFPA